LDGPFTYPSWGVNMDPTPTLPILVKNFLCLKPNLASLASLPRPPIEPTPTYLELGNVGNCLPKTSVLAGYEIGIS